MDKWELPGFRKFIKELGISDFDAEVYFVSETEFVVEVKDHNTNYLVAGSFDSPKYRVINTYEYGLVKINKFKDKYIIYTTSRSCNIYLFGETIESLYSGYSDCYTVICDFLIFYDDSTDQLMITKDFQNLHIVANGFQFKKFIGTFAVGELDGDVTVIAFEHLNGTIVNKLFTLDSHFMYCFSGKLVIPAISSIITNEIVKISADSLDKMENLRLNSTNIQNLSIHPEAVIDGLRVYDPAHTMFWGLISDAEREMRVKFLAFLRFRAGLPREICARIRDFAMCD